MDCLVIGIDGLEPSLVREWQDDLPTFNRLIESGAFGEITSSYPPLTSPAWPTINTGKQGGKHGIYTFTNLEDGGRKKVPVNFSDVRAEAIWEVLDANDVSTGVASVPITYPPSDLENGFVVAGWPLPNRATISDPPEVQRLLDAELAGGYDPYPYPVGPELGRMEPGEIADVMSDALWHHHRAFQTLLDEYGRELDVFYCMYGPIDHASHRLTFDLDHLKRLYVEQDEALDELLSRFDDDTDIVLLSDHGHTARGDLSFKTNEWLHSEGLLTKREQTGLDSDTVLRKLGLTRSTVIDLKMALGLKNIRSRIPQPLFDFLKETIPSSDTTTEYDAGRIDWDETVAFSPSQNVIFLNDERFGGVVADDDRDEVRQEIKRKLQELDHPREGKGKLMTYVHDKEELFSGPFADDAPDLVFVADEKRCACHIGFGDSVFSSHRWGEHRQDAVLITNGPSFESLETTEKRTVLDILPLVCATVGASMPEDVDGEVPTERFAEPPEVKFHATDDEGRDDTGYSDEDIDQIEDQLRGLGYMN